MTAADADEGALLFLAAAMCAVVVAAQIRRRWTQ